MGFDYRRPLRGLLPFYALFACFSALAADGPASGRWTAHWISVADASQYDYGVYHFRRVFELGFKPDRFPVRVSGDNRYILFVNGKRASEGPARGDLFHWRYESIDIARFLDSGPNTIAAVVWNEGPFAGVAQISNESGFWMEGDSETESAIDTGSEWRGAQDTAYAPLPTQKDQITGYMAIGPGERFDASKHPWGWEQRQFDDSKWARPRLSVKGEPRGARDGRSRWMLVESSIPLPERKALPSPRIRRTDFNGTLENIPAKTRVTLLLDQEELTTGTPQLVISGGLGSAISIRYAEGLWERLGPNWKGDRNVVEGKKMLGYQDVYLADGGERRIWEPLWWRTWRYLEVHIETAEQPLQINALNVNFTGYPFQQRARFSSNPQDLTKILSVGWQTARLCAHETYMDCPYYEQLQYAGDTRIQGLVSIYNSGDVRLLRNAIQQIDQSRTSEGLTYSRAPSNQAQYIPGFSLWWIGMVHDYWMYVDDPPFVKEMLPGVRAVLTWFAAHQRQDQTLAKLPWWNYLDWTPTWTSGVPPERTDGGTASADMELALAMKWAAELELALGNPALGQQYRTSQGALLQSIRKAYYDDARGLFADTTDHRDYSQQTNALAAISGTVTGDLAKSVLRRTLSDSTLTPASTYFLAYVNEALKDAGLGDLYLDQLKPWHRMLDLHLTTWAENLNRDRSDCHAWGSSPNYELYRTVLGIDSAAPGFKRVRIAPNLGSLTEAAGTIPHPKGEISVKYSFLVANGVTRLRVEVDLPPETTGEFLWKEQRRGLRTGHSAFVLQAPAEHATIP